MTPVHPIETSSSTRRPRDRRAANGRPRAVFQVPSDEAAADAERLASPRPTPSTALVALEAGSRFDIMYANESSHAFVENVTRVLRAPLRVTGWFLDLSV